MKTPIQELIDSVRYMAQGLDADELYDYFMEEATRMLEKEKKVMYDAWLIAISNFRNDTFFEEYYNETFNTKEK